MGHARSLSAQRHTLVELFVKVFSCRFAMRRIVYHDVGVAVVLVFVAVFVFVL